MKKSIRKLTAMVIVAVMVLGIFPPFEREVLANPQNPVNTLTMIMLNPNMVGSFYQIQFNWARPSFLPVNVGAELAPGAVATTPGTYVTHVMGPAGSPGASIHAPDGGANWYRLMFSRHTTATNMIFPGGDNLEHVVGVPLQTLQIELLHMDGDGGAIYAFEVVPYHHELVRSWGWLDIGGSLVLVGTGAGINEITPHVSGNKWLFMTDIEVHAEGREGQIHVSWDLPLLDGFAAFDNWRIDVRESGTNTLVGRLTVPHSDLLIAGRRAQFSITQDMVGLVPLQQYDIYIEPMTGPFLIRYQPIVPVDLRLVSGFPIRFSDAYYVHRGSFISVELRVREYDDRSIELSWLPGFGGLPVTLVNVLRSHDRDVLETFRDDPLERTDVLRNSLLMRQITGFHNVANILRFISDRPMFRTYFMLEFYLEGSSIPQFSTIVFFDPMLTLLRPTRPIIRQVYHEPPEPPGIGLTVIWDAFLRSPINQVERNNVIVSSNPRLHGQFHDQMIRYDIYVADDLTLLDIMMRDPTNPGTDSRLAAVAGLPGGGNFWFTSEHATNPRLSFTYGLADITSHFTRRADGVIVQIDRIDPNRVYYVRVVAVQVDEHGTPTGTMDDWAWADYAHFVPATELFARPTMLSKPPLRIRQLPAADGLPARPDVGFDHITVEWDLRYFEIFNPVDRTWHSRVGVSGGQLYFGDDILRYGIPSQNIIELIPGNLPFMSQAGFGHANAMNVENRDFIYNLIFGTATEQQRVMHPLRYVDFVHPPPASRFAMYWMTYDEFRQFGTMENFLLMGDFWNRISDDQLNVGTVTSDGNTMWHRIEDLEEHTSYVIILWPYIIDTVNNNTIMPAFEPSNIIGSTLGDRPHVDRRPTVPRLYPHMPPGSMHLTVGWFFDDSLQYRLFLADLPEKFPYNYDMSFSDAIIRQYGYLTNRLNPLTGLYEPYMEFTITNLFPDTVYYIWLRAYFDNPEPTGLLESAPSNLVIMRTANLEPPPPPTGLGLVGRNNLSIINARRGDDDQLVPIDRDYFILEWNRIVADVVSIHPESVIGEDARLLVEHDRFGDLGESWATLSTLILQVVELQHNAPYFIRAKTRMTVFQIQEQGVIGARAHYQYVVQISIDEDFIDFIEIIIPAQIDGGATGGRSITLDSVWTATIRLFTSTWDGEYAGAVDPHTYPLPEDDFEIIWDPVTQTLTYRFRSDQVDQDGHRDNRVDLRFISRLIDSGIFNFEIDLSTYGFYRDIIPRRRVVEMPFSVYSAMADRHISLTLIMGDTTFAFPARYLDIPELNAMPGFGYRATIRITAEDNPAGMIPSIDTTTTTYAVGPTGISIDITAGTNTMGLTRLNQPFTVTQRAADPRMMLDGNSAGYFSNRGLLSWTLGDYRINGVAGTVSQNTTELGMFAVLTRVAPLVFSDNPAAVDTLHRVNRHITFEGMQVYDPTATISSAQFNKLLAALIQGSRSVNLEAPLTPDEHSSLTRSGLLASHSEAMTREEAISSMVRLFELRTRTRIQNFTPLAQTIHLDIATASPGFQEGLLKAADLGFFENRAGSVRPMDFITMDELLRIVDLIIEIS